MTKTNNGLVEYVKAKVGCYYWFGTFGQMASNALYKAKKSQYPKYYTATDFNTQIKNPKQVFDCAGLIKAYLWTDSIDDVTPTYKSSQDYGATAFYNRCTKKGKISSFDHVKGRLVFKGANSKMTHVGVYIGDGKIVEAKGHKYGVIISNLDASWTHWGQCNLISEDSAPAPTPAPAPAPSAENYKVKTNGSTLALRSAPSAKSSLIVWMPNGSKVTVDRSEGGWMHTTYKGKTGWSYGKWLTKI